MLVNMLVGIRVEQGKLKARYLILYRMSGAQDNHNV